MQNKRHAYRYSYENHAPLTVQFLIYSYEHLYYNPCKLQWNTPITILPVSTLKPLHYNPCEHTANIHLYAGLLKHICNF
jgi:hypothetical protein